MVKTHECPLCDDPYEKETDLRVHLEVEHRKSELATYVVAQDDRAVDPTVDRERRAPTP